jgi:hypothetical protein
MQQLGAEAPGVHAAASASPHDAARQVGLDEPPQVSPELQRAL